MTATNRLEDGHPEIRSRRVNGAVLKGVILVIVGVAILAAPDRTTTVLRWIFGLALVANMAVDLYVAVRHPRDRWRLVFAGTASGLVGMSFLLFPEVALRVVAGGVALIVAIYGLQLATKAFRGDRDTAGRAWSLGSGIVAIALAVVLAVLPEAVILTLLLAAAVSSIIYGALAIIIGLEADGDTDVDLLDLTDVIRRWLNERDVGDDRRAAVSEGLDFEPPEAVNKRVSYSLMLGLSVIIATLAVLQDSTAVIIGAMLIAPLMTPIMAMAAGVVGGWRDRVGSAAIILVLSVAASIGLAWIVAEWVPALVPLGVNSQVQGRIQPTVVDLLIALAAGAAGAYATVDKRVSSSIAGVAIAVALVPPLSIVGVTLHGRQYDWAAGAMLLFTTNFVAIFIAGVVVFALVGFVPFRTFYEKRRNVRAVVASVATAALIILIPLTFSAQGILTSSNQDSTALEVTIEWVADTDLEAVGATVVDRTVTVEVEGTGEIPGASDLQRELADALDMDVEVRIEYAPIAVVTYSIEQGEEVQVPNMIVSP